MKRRKRKEKSSRETSDVHDPLTDVQCVPKQKWAAPGQVPPVYVLGMTFHGMEYPSGQFRAALLAMLAPCFLCTYSGAEHWTFKSPCLK